MPFPIALVLGAGIGGVLRTVGLGYLITEMSVKINDVIESGGVSEYVTGVVNRRMEAAGVPLTFSNVFDLESVKADVDKAAAGAVNAKAGTNLQGLRALSKDDLLAELSRTIADKVNAECGSQIAALWPVQRFRDELGTELGRQLLADDLAPGGLFPQARLSAVKLEWVKKMPGYRDPVNPQSDPVKLSQSRARQKKYRRTHKYVAVPR